MWMLGMESMSSARISAFNHYTASSSSQTSFPVPPWQFSLFQVRSQIPSSLWILLLCEAFKIRIHIVSEFRRGVCVLGTLSQWATHSNQSIERTKSIVNVLSRIFLVCLHLLRRGKVSSRTASQVCLSLGFSCEKYDFNQGQELCMTMWS